MQITVDKALTQNIGIYLFRPTSACLQPRKEGQMLSYGVSLNYIHESCTAFQDNLYK